MQLLRPCTAIGSKHGQMQAIQHCCFILYFHYWIRISLHNFNFGSSWIYIVSVSDSPYHYAIVTTLIWFKTTRLRHMLFQLFLNHGSLVKPYKTQHLTSIGSGNGLFLDSTKPSLEPMLLTSMTSYAIPLMTNSQDMGDTSPLVVVSSPDSKQWLMIHISDLIMIIRWSTNIFTIIKKEMGKLKTHSHIYCIKDNWENWLHLKYIFNRICDRANELNCGLQIIMVYLLYSIENI